MEIKCKVPLRFKKEWKILATRGVPFSIKIGPGVMTGKWIWEEDNVARLDEWKFEIIDTKFQRQLEEIIGEGQSENFFEDFYDTFETAAYKNKEYEIINKRIAKFIQETESYGEQKYGDKLYLWDWFWDNQ